MSALLQAVRVRPTTKRGSGGAHTVPLRPHAAWCGGAPLSGLGEGRALTLTGSMKGFDDGGTEYARDTTSVCVRSWYSRAVQHGEAAKLPPSSLSSTVAGAVGVLLAVGSAVATPAAFAEPVVGLVDGHLRGCAPRTSCVSTSAGNAPSQYMPPWDYSGMSRDQAYGKLRRGLVERGATVTVEEPGRYLQARIPYGRGADVDVGEFLFVEDAELVVYRDSSVVNTPDPPGCIKFGCINGPRNRGRMDALRDAVGFLSYETDEEKVWVPLLLH